MEEIRKFDFADSKTVKNIINNYILTEETLVKQFYNQPWYNNRRISGRCLEGNV